MPYRFSDAFWSSGRSLSASLGDGTPLMSRVTPAGYFVPRTAQDESDFLAAAKPYGVVADDRTYEEAVLEKDPAHFWLGCAPDNPGLLPDLGSNPIDLGVVTSPPETLATNPFIRTSTAQALYTPAAALVDLNAARYTPIGGWSASESSGSRADYYRFTYEVWYLPIPGEDHSNVYLGRVAGGWMIYHSAERARFSIYKADNATQVSSGSVPAVPNAVTNMLATGSVPLHYAASYDGLTARFYVNGQQVVSNNNDFVPDQNMFTVNNHYYFPLSAGTAGNFPSGHVAGIAFYRRVLTAAEILDNYRVGAPL